MMATILNDILLICDAVPDQLRAISSSDFCVKPSGKWSKMRFQEKYHEFHQQVLVADGKAVSFYKKCGFEPAGDTKSMWIYKGDDH